MQNAEHLQQHYPQQQGCVEVQHYVQLVVSGDKGLHHTLARDSMQ